MSRSLLLTPGDPAGVGPEIACRLASVRPELLLVADPGLLERNLERLGLDCKVLECDPEDDSVHEPGSIRCWPVELARIETPGRVDPANAGYVLDCLGRAADACLDGRAAGLVTGPLHKGVINQAGIPFSGHTEFLAERAGVERVVMMLVAGRFRVALATTHLPLREVPDAIQADSLRRTLRILDHDLRFRFAIERPRIAVLGLNPHAGEGGYLGREEIEVIEPVLEAERQAGLDLIGPLPADTAMVPERVREFDAVLAMYHDQGLPVLKYAGFGQAVNVTLGLPFLRTSVDHGTALDIAGKNRADAGSLLAAVDLAMQLQSNAP
ncbi:4-hydroxythreonine-4-phosphate dehydrogenase PdxA [Wenzhouxiangella marina]|uniref:4-hydroxythreonine-4-phosphate dehydrogenase n=1 Tax=Wenzhouxiangella marina TaxID=1579979 RepID=A0A0K0XZ29_9GAMM|nr:4-hydroxythreonine-4-phosphate dehydrogenase PdxA [Wenzhouxiangella marina]AKS42943.1 4-hydroxythreonine-4-phosphate dehydrogenase [Wenzhouxiangella marina]MBB6087373.1 4-hydroxythreonine-4-phosphate dehydrogenase [Wenzhouxiangella marina]